MKHIICSGCSFTRQFRRLNIDGTDTNFLDDYSDFYRWPHWIQKIYKDVKVYNLGSPTNDNNIIKKSIFDKVNTLRKSGVKYKDIIVIAQWSDYFRNSFYIDEETANKYNSTLPTTNEEKENRVKGYEEVNLFAHISDYIEDKEFVGKYGYWLLTGGYNFDHIPYDVKELIYKYVEYFQNDSQSLINFFDNVISLQSFLDSRGIKHLSFNLQNNFILKKSDLFKKDNVYKSIYVDKWLPNSYTEKLSYDNPYVQNLFELINLNDFWFYNGDDTTNGGILEWGIKNYDIDNYDFRLFMEIEKNNIKRELKQPIGHISSKMNKLFVEKELKEFLKCLSIK